MAERMTPDRLRAIIEMDAQIEDGLCPPSMVHRGELLDLLRRVARYKTREHRLGCSFCRYCGGLSACETDCPAPLLEVFVEHRKEASGG